MWDGHLATHGAQLIAARVDLVNQLAPEVEKAYQLLAPASRAAAVRYRSSVETVEAEAAAGTVSVELFEAALLAELARRRAAELERGVCLVGPHRDDLELRLGDQPAKGFASHGESWSMALALRLAAYELLRSEGSDPVLLLDDVFAELDTARRRALVDVAASAEQVLVTAAVHDDVPVGLGCAQNRDRNARRRHGSSLGGDRMTESEDAASRQARQSTWRICAGWIWCAARSRRPAAPRAVRARTSAAAARRPARRVAGRGRRRTWSGPGPGRAGSPDVRLGDHGSGTHPRLDPSCRRGLRSSASGRRWSASRSPSTRTRRRCARACSPSMAESTAWATQLRMVQAQILAKIAAAVGDGVVTSLKIVGPTAPTWRKGRYHIAGRGPATPTDERRTRRWLRAASVGKEPLSSGRTRGSSRNSAHGVI